MLGEQDRQLDHGLRLQLPGGDAVQDVAEGAAPVVARGGGELDDRAGVHPCLHLPGEAGDCVVRLVHDHERAVDVEQVGKREPDPAAVEPFEPGRALGDGREVRLQVLVVGIDLAALGAPHSQGLDGAGDDAAVVAEIVGTDVREVRDVDDPYPPGERLVQRLPVGMAGVLERLDGLPADGVGRREPQHQGMVLLNPGVAGDGDGVGAEERLTASGGKAQADVGDFRKSG